LELTKDKPDAGKGIVLFGLLAALKTDKGISGNFRKIM
jgi:hypothetical protein